MGVQTFITTLMVDISTCTNVKLYLSEAWQILDEGEQSALAVLPPGQCPPPPVRTEFEDDLTPDAVCKLYHSLELHQDFSAFHLLVQSISRIRCAVSSNFNLPKLKRIKKNYLNFRRVEKSFCLLVQEKDEIPTLFCSLFCFGVRYVEWGVGVGWERTNKGQGGWKGFTLEVSAIETAKVCKSEK